MAKKREPVWATRLRDLLHDFKAAKKRSRLRFVLIQTTGTDIKELQPSDSEVASGSVSISRTPVTVDDGTAAQRIRYRFGSTNDPAVALIERGNDILNRHGDVILKLFGLKFVRTWESNWPWLLATLAEVEHPFRGDIKADRELAGYFSGKEQIETLAYQDGSGPKPNWWDERHQSFRADISHVAVASIAAIRAILERVDALSAAKDKLGSRKEPATGTTKQQTVGKRPGINARMLEAMQANPQMVMGWSAARWAKHLKCAKSSIAATATWKDLMMARERVKAERAVNRRRKPKGSDLRRNRTN